MIEARGPERRKRMGWSLWGRATGLVVVLYALVWCGRASTAQEISQTGTQKLDIATIERAAIEQIKREGVGERFAVREWTPGISLGGGAEGPSYCAGTISQSPDGVRISFEFPGDCCIVRAGGFTGFARYSDQSELGGWQVTNGVFVQAQDPRRDLLDILFAPPGWEQRAGKTMGAEDSVHRFSGQAKVGDYTFIGEGDKSERLTFALVKGVGYVYLRGKGRVRLKNGQEVVFPIDSQAHTETRSSSVLHDAAKKGDVGEVRRLLSEGASVNAKDSAGGTPLIWATVNGHLETVKCLIAENAAVDSEDNNGQTALMYACWMGHLDIAKLLVENGAGVNHMNRGGATPLCVAYSRSHRDIVRYLIEKQTDLSVQDVDGRTFLMGALEAYDIDMIRYAVEKGAQVNAKGGGGQTVLMSASSMGYPEVVRYLCDRGADVNARDDKGHTALMAAARGYNSGRFTLEKQVGDTTVKLRVDHVEVAKCLLERGADVNAVDSDGKTALKHARDAVRLDDEMVRFLRAAGAKD
jgi:ankyrin repeat protein